MRLSGHSPAQTYQRVQPLEKPAEAVTVSMLAVTTRVQLGGALTVGMADAAIHVELSITRVRRPSKRRPISSSH